MQLKWDIEREWISGSFLCDNLYPRCHFIRFCSGGCTASEWVLQCWMPIEFVTGMCAVCSFCEEFSNRLDAHMPGAIVFSKSRMALLKSMDAVSDSWVFRSLFKVHWAMAPYIWQQTTEKKVWSWRQTCVHFARLRSAALTAHVCRMSNNGFI